MEMTSMHPPALTAPSAAPPNSINASSTNITASSTAARLAALLVCAPATVVSYLTTVLAELGASTEVVFRSKLTWMLALGPLAVFADFSGFVSESVCFCLAGLALIPCAERLSFVTEQIAMHTNGTIGGLLNATFGNAPELLIATAALRSGYYRIVQLAMLGSMLTNMLLVFGIACAIGGSRWQVQELRTTTGNANIVMLYVAVAGCLFPAALRLSGQYNNPAGLADDNTMTSITPKEVTFCRVNAVVLFVLYVCFLAFQLGTHRDEFESAPVKRRGRFARRNHSCRALWYWIIRRRSRLPAGSVVERVPFLVQSSSLQQPQPHEHGDQDLSSLPNGSAADEEEAHSIQSSVDSSLAGNNKNTTTTTSRRRKLNTMTSSNSANANSKKSSPKSPPSSPRPPVWPTLGESAHKAKTSETWEDLESDDDEDRFLDEGAPPAAAVPENHHHDHEEEEEAQLNMRMGIIWLLILTLCISSMSDILVDSIDEFATSMRLSEVFTSMVIIPFFSNVAEQVSAFIFAYRNEMDLCVAVTIGSAVQIATFVLPGTVLIGMTMDRSMTLYFGAYETCCLFFSVVVVGAVLQSGTSNWLTGGMLVGIYLMFAAGIWFHQLEELTVDGESKIWKGRTDSGPQ